MASPDEPFTRWFVEAHSPEAVKQLALLTAEKTSGFMNRLAEKIEPGGALFILLRKRFVEDEVRRALAEGAEQVVVLGAGYDPLCLQLEPLFPKARFYELDHPWTQTVKRRALEERRALPGRVALVPIDLGHDRLAAVLDTAPGFSRQARTIFVAEGVLMYLRPADNDAVFADVRRSAGSPSRFVFSALDERLLAQRGSAPARTAKLLAISGEPIRWALDPEAAGKFLAERGFRLVSSAGRTELGAAYLQPAGIDRTLGEGEWLAVAEATGST